MTDSPGRRPLVAIVGGGFSGAAVAIHLLRAESASLRVVLVEPADEPGRGLAYATPFDGHRMNVPAARLGLDPAHEGGFVDWLRAQGLPGGGASFVPRRWFGSYVAAELARAAAGAGARHAHVRARAVALARDGAGFALRLSDGSTLAADRVVLATGHAPPQGVHAHVVVDPWHPDALAGLAPTHDVVLLGSGLTAVDVLLQLRERGHRGRVHLLSRRGLLPQPHRHNDTRPAAVPALELGDARGLRALVAAVRAWIARLEQAGGDWRDAIAGLRPVTPAIWQGLGTRDRHRFLRHLTPIWDTHRHRCAPDVHQRLVDLLRDGHATLQAGRVRGIERRDDGTLSLRWQPRGSNAESRLAAARVINCTGTGTDLSRSTDPLHASLRDAGLLRAEATGQGLHVDASLQLIDADGVAVDGLFHVGPLLRASLWEAVAVPELRVHARDVARTIVAQLALRRSS